MNRTQLQQQIERHGRISVRDHARAARKLRGAAATRPVSTPVWEAATAVTARKKNVVDRHRPDVPGRPFRPTARTLRGVPAKDLGRTRVRRDEPAVATAKTDEVIGEPDTGFGQTFHWDRSQEQIALAVFLNAADSIGVSITGVARGDLVEVTSASGVCSFDESEGNPRAAALIGLIGAGAAGTVAVTGSPEAAPFVNEATKHAQELFKGEKGLKKMRRDAFGQDPGTGQQARAEGGVLVSMPGSGGPAYSGNRDHKERWLKGHEPRRDDQLPAHVRGRGFFPVRGDAGHNSRQVRTGDEPLFVTPWDWKFEDNAGFYKLFLRITQGSALPDPPPVE